MDCMGEKKTTSLVIINMEKELNLLSPSGGQTMKHSHSFFWITNFEADNDSLDIYDKWIKIYF